jgi:hypothetical protein
VYRRSFVLIIAGLLINLVCPLPVAAQQSAKEFRRIARIKAEVASLSTEPQREIIATLSDDTEVKGYVTSFSADRFTVKDTKTGVVTPISFSEVKHLRKKLSTSAKVGAFATVGGAVVGMFYLLSFGLSKCKVCVEF